MQSAFNKAREHIKNAAETKEFAETKNAFKNRLMEQYEDFGDTRQVKVSGADGKTHNVTIDESTVKNVIKDIEAASSPKVRNAPKITDAPDVSAEKLIVLNNIDAIIKNSTLVESGKVTTKTSGKTIIAQHDYFEAPVTIGGKKYTARFDVTVNKSTGRNTVTGIDVIKAPEAGGSSKYQTRQRPGPQCRRCIQSVHRTDAADVKLQNR